MIHNRAAIRYAKAILAFAQEQKVEKAVQKDFVHVQETLQASPDLFEFLQSPVLDAAAKQATLVKVFPKQADATQ